jgi:hydrogenase maturation protease
VVARLKGVLKDREGIHFLALHQLEPDLVEQLRDATVIILVDAAINEIKGEWQWTKIGPQLSDVRYLMHHIQPAFLLGLLQSIYRQSPLTWLISIQGDDFDFGEGLTPPAKKRAHRVIAEIVNFIHNQDRIFRIPRTKK